MRTPVSPGHARPSRPKLSVLLRCSYAVTSQLCADPYLLNDQDACFFGAGADILKSLPDS